MYVYTTEHGSLRQWLLFSPTAFWRAQFPILSPFEGTNLILLLSNYLLLNFISTLSKLLTSTYKPTNQPKLTNQSVYAAVHQPFPFPFVHITLQNLPIVILLSNHKFLKKKVNAVTSCQLSFQSFTLVLQLHTIILPKVAYVFWERTKKIIWLYISRVSFNKQTIPIIEIHLININIQKMICTNMGLIVGWRLNIELKSRWNVRNNFSFAPFLSWNEKLMKPISVEAKSKSNQKWRECIWLCM
jgi:hypothetical protein